MHNYNCCGLPIAKIPPFLSLRSELETISKMWWLNWSMNWVCSSSGISRSSVLTKWYRSFAVLILVSSFRLFSPDTNCDMATWVDISPSQVFSLSWHATSLKHLTERNAIQYDVSKIWRLFSTVDCTKHPNSNHPNWLFWSIFKNKLSFEHVHVLISSYAGTSVCVAIHLCDEFKQGLKVIYSRMKDNIVHTLTGSLRLWIVSL